jgi:uncharacterized protein YutE (UPF0331/DUF86 family)
MSQEAARIHLVESLGELERALAHLSYSEGACAGIAPGSSAITEDELISVEAFTSRFARLVDLLTKRVLKALDHFELAEPGTLLDIANRAEKRGLIPSVDWLRELKDARNRIAHDYAGDRLPKVLAYCRAEFPQMVKVCGRVQDYCRNRLNTPDNQ